MGNPVQRSYSKLLNLLYNAIEWGDESVGGADLAWLEGMLFPIRGSFDQISDLKRLCLIKQYKGKPINIVDSVIKLERHDEIYEAPMFKTSSQLFDWYQSRNKENEN